MGAGWQGKTEKETYNGEKTCPAAGALSWDATHRSTMLKLWSFSGAFPGETMWRRRTSKTSQARPGLGKD